MSTEARRHEFYCDDCQDTGYVPCSCDDGYLEPFCGDDICFGGGCITGMCIGRTCAACKGAGEFECECVPKSKFDKGVAND